MKHQYMWLPIVLVIVSACQTGSEATSELQNKIAALDACTIELDEKTKTLNRALKIQSDLIDTAGVLEFFKEEQSVIDVGLAGCSSNCARHNRLRRELCKLSPEDERCSETNLADLADRCQRECVKHFERPIVE